MPMIREAIVTTVSAAGKAHVAPFGLIAEGKRWVIAPFRPSTTLENLLALLRRQNSDQVAAIGRNESELTRIGVGIPCRFRHVLPRLPQMPSRL